ncbi:unnamed protein product [Didymodactylos carnosus]|uniref:Uncharacterized protein n=1 Tax=Didymodactylos carnosus TaxID=1234261 RepID=A0A814YV91_9BILA|nr:unnamed protein product [Didymodactylos carnosus]CAF3996045.1 unnamed protein product [Didymodactylos carnosus]
MHYEYQTKKLWHRLRITNLSPSIFTLLLSIFKNSFDENDNKQRRITTADVASILSKDVFKFINKLLVGDVGLTEMLNLKTTFSNNSIDIKNEVIKLYLSQSGDSKNLRRQIEKIYEWLQIYQYFSFISTIIDCIKSFEIIDDNNQSITQLKNLSNIDDKRIKHISESYETSKIIFNGLDNKHLQLIKVTLECHSLIQMFKKADLYSRKGRLKFRELRDNLTTQFQLQEKFNLILNALIVTYAVCEPFVLKVLNVEEFFKRLLNLHNIDESINQLRIVNENIQLVNLWLSTDEISTLDNALITMGRLYKSGKIDIHLKHLIDEKSYFELNYSIEKIRHMTTLHDIDNISVSPLQQQQSLMRRYYSNEIEKINFTMSQSDIIDHKRQLTFCNVDLQNMSHKKLMLDGQLQILKIIENIFSLLIRLESVGHPHYQMKIMSYDISDKNGDLSLIMKKESEQQQLNITDITQVQTSLTVWIDNLRTQLKTLDMTLKNLVHCLQCYRKNYPILKLFTNRQIMIMLILISSTSTNTELKAIFLNQLYDNYLLNNQQNEDHVEQKQQQQKRLTIDCMKHYLRMIEIHKYQNIHDDLFERYLKEYSIELRGDIEHSLDKLYHYLLADKLTVDHRIYVYNDNHTPLYAVQIKSIKTLWMRPNT